MATYLSKYLRWVGREPRIDGTSDGTLASGNDPRLLDGSTDRNQRWFQSPLPIFSNLLLTSGTAYFVYLGRTTSAVTIKYLEVFLSTVGGGTQNIEFAVATAPSAPSKANKMI